MGLTEFLECVMQCVMQTDMQCVMQTELTYLLEGLLVRALQLAADLLLGRRLRHPALGHGNLGETTHI